DTLRDAASVFENLREGFAIDRERVYDVVGSTPVLDHVTHPRQSAAVRRRAQPLSTDDARTRLECAGVRSGGPDQGAGTGTGPDAASSRRGISSGRSGA